ncbi:transposase [Nitrobacter hamburgensis]|uniref:transposase n=1 Tax=Nitrobacter hamburgensis TaxID=912 RepID=UPI001FD8F025|nr:transposase [Nitrobacter hamburgensis]
MPKSGRRPQHQAQGQTGCSWLQGPCWRRCRYGACGTNRVTPANINDGKAGPAALPDNPGEVFADSAYRGNHFGDAVRARGGTPRIVATGMRGRDEAETLARLAAWNQPIHRIRGRIEKIFGTWKRSYGLRRMRWRGLAKAAAQIRLTAIAYNLRRTLTIIAAA